MSNPHYQPVDWVGRGSSSIITSRTTVCVHVCVCVCVCVCVLVCVHACPSTMLEWKGEGLGTWQQILDLGSTRPYSHLSNNYTVQLTCKVNAPYVCHAVVPHFTHRDYFCNTQDCAGCYVSGREGGGARTRIRTCVYSSIGDQF